MRPLPPQQCRVCGLSLDAEWERGELCPCCNVEFGYEDGWPEHVRAYRKEWIARGAPWSSPKERPPDWSLERQLRDVPPEYR